ncbi:hypothetical protein [Nonomuraea sp. LPB2021202275-12-8]|uniref:hypothetical protein n=1 Tax=Nonomuraea sp. LPB2021202275-12-8 TaxID=3120159 RepID=UPI00300C34C5
MSDALLAVFAVVLSFALFIVGGWFFFRKPESGPPAGATEYKAEQTWTAKTTRIAITWVRRALGPAEAERAAPRDDAGNRDEQGNDEPQTGATIVVEQVRPHAPSSPPPTEPARPAVAPPSPPKTEVTVEPPRPARSTAVEAKRLDDHAHDPAPAVELEGIDMSQAPLAPAGNGTTTPLPTVPQLQEALATGGFDRFMTWLRAFFRASGVLETDARDVHEDAMRIAARARNKYLLALQAFNAVQADGLDHRTITRMWEVLAQAEEEATAAATATHYTASVVTACGGAQPAVAAVMSALDNGHGDVARSVKSAPVRVVRRMSFYEN